MEEFYGLEVFAGKPVKPNVAADRVLHISQIALPPNAAHAVTLLVKSSGKAFVLATLDPQQALFHVNVDMLFSGTQDLIFTCEGAAGAAVHLVGYTQLAEEEEPEDDMDDDMDDDDGVRNGAMMMMGDDDDDE